MTKKRIAPNKACALVIAVLTIAIAFVCVGIFASNKVAPSNDVVAPVVHDVRATTEALAGDASPSEQAADSVGDETTLVGDTSPVEEAQPTPADPQTEASDESPDVEAVYEEDTSAGADVSFERGVVLMQVKEDASVDDVNAMLSGMSGIATTEVTQEQIDSGCVSLTLDGTLSEYEAIDQVETSNLVEGAQPNYYYTLLEMGTAADLAKTLEAQTTLAPTTVVEPKVATPTTPAEAETSAHDPETPKEAEPPVASVDTPQTPDDGEPTEPVEPTTTAATEPATDEATKPLTDASTTPETATTAEAATGPAALLEAASVSINDPKANQQWAHASVRTNEAWSLSRSEGEVSVAVIDTGCIVTHEDLAANVKATYNSVDGGTDVTDTNSHGTHVAGIVSAVSNNGKGVSGTSYNAGLVIVKAVGANGMFSSVDLVSAYTYIIANASKYNIRVVNMSLGGEGTCNKDYSLMKSIDKADDAGILTVCAAGNATPSLTVPYADYPGDYETCLSVINLYHDSPTDKRSGSSNYNIDDTHMKDISAPGTSYYSTYNTNNSSYEYVSGTSMASPCVAGIAALLFAKTPSMTPAQARTTLCSTATDIYPDGWDRYTGYGEVDAFAALNADGRITGYSGVAKSQAITLEIEDATDTGWTWSSSDSSVARVSGSDSTASVTGVSAGSVTISATNEALPNMVLKKTVTVYSATIQGPDFMALSAQPTYSISVSPSGSSWTWSVTAGTGDGSIGASSGVFMPSKVGTVTISARSTTSTNVVFSKTVTVSNLAVDGPSVVALSERPTYTMSGVPADVALTWSVTAGTGAGSIDESTGAFTPGRAGTVTITAKGSSVEGEFTKTVTIYEPSVEGSADILISRQSTYTVSGAPSDTSWTWSVVAGTGAGSIDASTGVFTPSKVGTVTISARNSASSAAVCSKTVTIYSIAIQGPDSAALSDRPTYTVGGAPAGSKWAWNVTSKTGAGSIDASTGKFTPTKTGTVVVTAKSSSGEDVCTKTVTIYEPSVDGADKISISERPTYTVSGAPTGSKWTWSVKSGTGAGSIDASTGKLTPTKAGTVTISAQNKESSTAVCSKTVTIYSATIQGPDAVALSKHSTYSITSTPSGASWTWSVKSGTGAGSINASTGVFTPSKAGTVTISAKNASSTNVVFSKTVTVCSVSISGSSGVALSDRPTYAVAGAPAGSKWTWSVKSGTGAGSIDASTGKLTPTKAGTVVVTAKSSSLDGEFSKTVTIYSATVEGPSNTATSARPTYSITSTPSGASWTWSVTSGTGAGSINASTGVFTPSKAGTVTISAKNTAATNVVFSKTVTIDASAWTRIGGETCLNTMQGISQAGWPEGSSTVVVASRDGYWDALSASSLAGLHDCPILLVTKDSIPSEAAAEIRRLNAKTVYVVGGPAAISDAAMKSIYSCGATKVVRIGGATCKGTADAVAKDYIGSSSSYDTCIIATSASYHDAVVASPYAFAKRAPILLTDMNTGKLDASSLAIAAKYKNIVIMGGTAVVPESTVQSLKSANGSATITRCGGPTCFETATAFASYALSHGMNVDGMGVATSSSYYDALAGGPLIGRNGSVLVLMDDWNRTTGGKVYWNNSKSVNNAFVFGGVMAVSRGTWNYLN